MNTVGSSGIGAVSFGISGTLLALVVLAAVLVGAWKIGKMIWAAFSN